MIMQTKTPLKWEEKTLGKVCEVGAGNSAPQKKELFKEGAHCFIRTSDVGKIHIGRLYYAADKLNEEGIKGLKLFKKGTVLFPKSGASTFLNHRVIMSMDAYVASHLATIKANKDLLTDEFLFYYLMLVDSRKLVQDQNYPSLNLPTIANIHIKYPKDIEEQERIVEILDSAFEDIDQLKENAKQNLQNAKDLFGSYLLSMFKDNNWKTKTIEEVCDEIFAGGDAPKNNYSLEENEKHKVPIYANAVKDKGLYGYTDFARVNKPSITISARGSGTGHTEIRFNQYLPIVRLIVLIPNLSLINLRFLKYSIDNLDILKSGTAIPQLTVPMIKGYNLPLPTLEEQQSIVQKLDALQEETKQLEQIYQQKIQQAEELKLSILQKAFNGEL
jgi:type I restriction enzyme S subunit